MAKQKGQGLMYLVSTYWGGTLHVDNMKLVDDVKMLKQYLEHLAKKERRANLDAFLRQTSTYRVYEIQLNSSEKPKCLRLTALKKVLDDA